MGTAETVLASVVCVFGLACFVVCLIFHSRIEQMSETISLLRERISLLTSYCHDLRADLDTINIMRVKSELSAEDVDGLKDYGSRLLANDQILLDYVLEHKANVTRMP